MLNWPHASQPLTQLLQIQAAAGNSLQPALCQPLQCLARSLLDKLHASGALSHDTLAAVVPSCCHHHYLLSGTVEASTQHQQQSCGRPMLHRLQIATAAAPYLRQAPVPLWALQQQPGSCGPFTHRYHTACRLQRATWSPCRHEIPASSAQPAPPRRCSIRQATCAWQRMAWPLQAMSASTLTVPQRQLLHSRHSTAVLGGSKASNTAGQKEVREAQLMETVFELHPELKQHLQQTHRSQAHNRLQALLNQISSRSSSTSHAPLSALQLDHLLLLSEQQLAAVAADCGLHVPEEELVVAGNDTTAHAQNSQTHEEHGTGSSSSHGGNSLQHAEVHGATSSSSSSNGSNSSGVSTSQHFEAHDLRSTSSSGSGSSRDGVYTDPSRKELLALVLHDMLQRQASRSQDRLSRMGINAKQTEALESQPALQSSVSEWDSAAVQKLAEELYSNLQQAKAPAAAMEHKNASGDKAPLADSQQLHPHPERTHMPDALEDNNMQQLPAIASAASPPSIVTGDDLRKGYGGLHSVPGMQPAAEDPLHRLDPGHPYAAPPDETVARSMLARTVQKLLTRAGFPNNDPADPSACHLLKPMQLQELLSECGIQPPMTATHQQLATAVAGCIRAMQDSTTLQPLPATDSPQQGSDALSMYIDHAHCQVLVTHPVLPEKSEVHAAAFEAAKDAGIAALQAAGLDAAIAGGAAPASLLSKAPSYTKMHALAAARQAALWQLVTPHQVAAWLQEAHAQDVVLLERHQLTRSEGSVPTITNDTLQPDEAVLQQRMDLEQISDSSSGAVAGVDSSGRGQSLAGQRLVVATAVSPRHAAACASAVRWQVEQAAQQLLDSAPKGSWTALALAGWRPALPTGVYPPTDWAALEAGPFLQVHVLTQLARAYYKLEYAPIMPRTHYRTWNPLRENHSKHLVHTNWSEEGPVNENIVLTRFQSDVKQVLTLDTITTTTYATAPERAAGMARGSTGSLTAERVSTLQRSPAAIPAATGAATAPFSSPLQAAVATAKDALWEQLLRLGQAAGNTRDKRGLDAIKRRRDGHRNSSSTDGGVHTEYSSAVRQGAVVGLPGSNDQVSSQHAVSACVVEKQGQEQSAPAAEQGDSNHCVDRFHQGRNQSRSGSATRRHLLRSWAKKQQHGAQSGNLGTLGREQTAVLTDGQAAVKPAEQMHKVTDEAVLPDAPSRTGVAHRRRLLFRS